MELIEIKGLFEMDFGAPMPVVLSNDTELLLAFYAEQKNMPAIPQQKHIIDDTGVVALKFKRYLKYTFGVPGDEAINGHPYSKLGMKSYSFYELRDSDFIKSLQHIDKMHPQYHPDKWKMFKHYILTFHDNMFECIAESFEVREDDVSLYNQASDMFNELMRKNLSPH
ncbi:MAG: hypothetical protein REI78_00355 [Pedobacter sp.]|nr:hypothetical protein [Pedobacter sp.]